MNNLEFVFIDSVDNPQYGVYNDIFNKSIIKENNNNIPELKYEIDTSKFEEILYKIIRSSKSYKIPSSKISLNDYPEFKNIDGKIYFDNSFNWQGLLEYLQITHNEENPETSLLLTKIIKNMKKSSNIVEFIKPKHRIIFPSLMLGMEVPIIIVLDKSNVIPAMVAYLYFRCDEQQIFIEVIEVNNAYRNYNLYKRLISQLISIKPTVEKYALVNVGGLAGYSCYTDAFNANNFSTHITKNPDNINDSDINEVNHINNNTRKRQLNNLRKNIKQKITKLNLSKRNNITANNKFNSYMEFYKNT